MGPWQREPKLRSLKAPQQLLRRGLTPNKRTRSGTRSPSEDLKLRSSRETPRSSSEPSEHTTLLTDSLLLSTHFPVNPPSRPLRITTLSFSSFTKSNKKMIREACQQLYKIKVKKVNTLNTPRGEKKAYVALSSDQDALDIANKIGIM